MEDTDRRHASPRHVGLYDLATEQMGYFTSEQAAAHRYTRSLLSYHARRGNIQRVHHGVYRFRDYPPSPREDVVAAWLAVGKGVAVVSHETALELWDLSDVISSAVHLTVPRAQRSLARRPPPGTDIHTTLRPWRDGDIRTREGIRLTSPDRTILDAAEAGTQPEQVALAIAEALRRGWLDASRLRADARTRGQRVADLVDRALPPTAAVEHDATPRQLAGHSPPSI